MNDIKAIYVSINPHATKKIELGIKNHEFRNYIPKSYFNRMYVYETSPTSELKYIIDVDEVIEFPLQVTEDGDGNILFNTGNKSKFAYHLKTVYKLDEPICLNTLRTKYGFLPPQAFAYDKKYPELSKKLETTDKRLILKRGI